MPHCTLDGLNNIPNILQIALQCPEYPQMLSQGNSLTFETGLATDVLIRGLKFVAGKIVKGLIFLPEKLTFSLKLNFRWTADYCKTIIILKILTD